MAKQEQGQLDSLNELSIPVRYLHFYSFKWQNLNIKKYF